MNQNNPEQLDHDSKVKWHCRRGTLELDVLLNRYYDSAYPTADDEEKSLFLRLLEMQDPELLPFLMGTKVPEQQDLAALVNKIRSIPPDHT